MRLTKTLILSIVLFIVLALGFSVWPGGWFSKNTILNDNQQWTGSYEYGEAIPPSDSGIPGAAWSYNLDISQEDSGLVASLDIDGFQTLTRIEAIAEENNGMLDIVFDSYGPENIGASFHRGDVLFSLKKITDDAYLIIWSEMQPFVESDKNSNNEFKKNQ